MMTFERLDIDAVDWEQLDALPDRTVYQTRSWLDFIARAQNAEPTYRGRVRVAIKTRFPSHTGLGCGSGVTTPVAAGITDHRWASTAGVSRAAPSLGTTEAVWAPLGFNV
jgi:predicted sugar kinase